MCDANKFGKFKTPPLINYGFFQNEVLTIVSLIADRHYFAPPRIPIGVRPELNIYNTNLHCR